MFSSCPVPVGELRASTANEWFPQNDIGNLEAMEGMTDDEKEGRDGGSDEGSDEGKDEGNGEDDSSSLVVMARIADCIRAQRTKTMTKTKTIAKSKQSTKYVPSPIATVVRKANADRKGNAASKCAPLPHTAQVAQAEASRINSTRQPSVTTNDDVDMNELEAELIEALLDDAPSRTLHLTHLLLLIDQFDHFPDPSITSDTSTVHSNNMTPETQPATTATATTKSNLTASSMSESQFPQIVLSDYTLFRTLFDSEVARFLTQDDFVYLISIFDRDFASAQRKGEMSMDLHQMRDWYVEQCSLTRTKDISFAGGNRDPNVMACIRAVFLIVAMQQAIKMDVCVGGMTQRWMAPPVLRAILQRIFNARQLPEFTSRNQWQFFERLLHTFVVCRTVLRIDYSTVWCSKRIILNACFFFADFRKRFFYGIALVRHIDALFDHFFPKTPSAAMEV